MFLSAINYKGAVSSLNKTSQEALWPSSALENDTELKNQKKKKKDFNVYFN